MKQAVSLLKAGLVCLAMAGTAVISVVAAPTKLLSDTRPALDLAAVVPKTFGNWKIDPHVVPVPPSPDQANAMQQVYDQILARTYVNDKGDRMMLSIAYGSRQNQQMRAHRQEVCYSAQGFQISGLHRLGLPLMKTDVPATRLVARRGGRMEPITYWFTMGDYAAMSYTQREVTQLRYALKGLIPDGYLIRVSSLAEDPKADFPRQTDFANELMSALKPEVRQRLMGGSAS
jgi:EpsI family protein